MDREAFNEIAWRDFITFAWSQADAHAAFRGATGRPQRSRTNSPLDALIDKAGGGSEDDAYMSEFVDWVTKTQWGENYAPEKWKQRLPVLAEGKPSEVGKLGLVGFNQDAIGVIKSSAEVVQRIAQDGGRMFWERRRSRGLSLFQQAVLALGPQSLHVVTDVPPKDGFEVADVMFGPFHL